MRPNEVGGRGSLMPMRRLSAHNDSLLRSMRLVAPEEIISRASTALRFKAG